MKKIKIKKSKNSNPKKYLKMYMYIIIVNYGYSDTVLNMLWENGSNAQNICFGRGTANKDVLHMLGLEGNRKDVVLALVDETNVDMIKQQLNKMFLQSGKKLMGIGFTIPLTSIVGEKVYHFLTNTL